MEMVKDRRALHRIPELDRQLPKTAAYLTGRLEEAGFSVFSPAEGSVCAFLDVGAEDSLAFRADMDALPVFEQTGLPFASTHPGAMHACGHDGHMAILLELARRLGAKQPDRNILLIFQPAEETQGGALALCQSGILEKYRVTGIFGLHLWPGLPKGQFFSRPGPMMSRSCEVTAEFTGKAAHIGRAEEAADAMDAAVRFYTQAVKMERELDGNIPRLLKFGHLQAGTVRNVIAGSARLEGSLRTFHEEVFAEMVHGLEQIGEAVEKKTGCKVSLRVSQGYPAVTNDRELLARARQLAPVAELENPTIITEDFSWYQRYVPGVFFFLGLGDTPALHASNFDFDEGVLSAGADFMERLARET